MRGVLGGSPPQRLFEEAVTQSAEALVTEYCALFRYEESRATLVAEALAGWSNHDPGEWELSCNLETHVGYTAVSGKPYEFAELSAEKRLNNDHDLHGEGIRSGIALPVRVGNGVWGVLAAHSRSRRHFSPEDHECLTAIADCIASAVETQRANREKTRLLREYEREINRAQARYALIASAAVELNHAGDEPKALRAGARLIAQGLGDLCHVDLLERTRNEVQVRRFIAGGPGVSQTAYEGRLTPMIRAVRPRAPDPSHPSGGHTWLATPAGTVETEEYQAGRYVFNDDRAGMAGTPAILRRPRPQIVNFAEDGDNPLPEIILDPRARSLLEGRQITAYMCVPLLSRGQLLGAVGVAAAGQRSFDEADLDLLDHMANLICLSLDPAGDGPASRPSRQVHKAAPGGPAVAFTSTDIETLRELETNDTYPEIARRVGCTTRGVAARVERLAVKLGVRGKNKRHKVLAAARTLGYTFGQDPR